MPGPLHVVPHFGIIDESADWLVVDKPAPLIVHPANRQPEPTLLGGIEQLLSFEIANGDRPAVVNRLDRDTSGIVLAAKHRQAARELGLIFDRREVDKEYLSIVSGWPDADDWTCDAPILRAGELGPSPIWVRQIAHSAGKPCLTRFRVEQRFTRAEGRFSLVRCFPETGRMHQIRVHLAHAGFPIVGDKLYTGDGAAYLAWMDTGWTEELRQRLLLPRHALHAARLSLPWNGRLLEWRSDLPEDLTAFIAGRPHCPPPGIELWSRHDRSAETPAELRPSAEMLPSAPPRR